MSPRILMVLTSHDRLGDTGEPTGFWLEELAAPYYACLDAGAEVVLASPKGGKPPLDPKSDAEESRTEATRRFQQDDEAQQALANTRRLSEVSADDFDAVFYPGGHGPLWDLVDDADSIRLIEAFWAQQKPVSAVCHAPIALIHAHDTHGEPIIRGRDVTGFTNGEEAAVGLTDVVPHLVEDALIAGGARYSKADDFAPYTRRDGQLITGQNPASSEPTARLLLEALGP
ncbi:type 1 glutamine amidotransferase domain-containing protein [Billgrantia pellis]|uniref:Type 1 glutamine amidotransferase domain-containing protein n=1 Tax=Billgrantia pellis TaxID=2606936 RepID=A0A7V7G1V1_9GAMM|nr:type 1 glutamine amidotransferase domain-containing protein [Halomonas pellis]KAA0013811.1 type 1 glutamine amidotransferase domain-containing protein [Halomonas pellis]